MSGVGEATAIVSCGAGLIQIYDTGCRILKQIKARRRAHGALPPLDLLEESFRKSKRLIEEVVVDGKLRFGSSFEEGDETVQLALMRITIATQNTLLVGLTQLGDDDDVIDFDAWIDTLDKGRTDAVSALHALYQRKMAEEMHRKKNIQIAQAVPQGAPPSLPKAMREAPKLSEEDPNEHLPVLHSPENPTKGPRRLTTSRFNPYRRMGSNRASLMYPSSEATEPKEHPRDHKDKRWGNDLVGSIKTSDQDALSVISADSGYASIGQTASSRIEDYHGTQTSDGWGWLRPLQERERAALEEREHTVLKAREHAALKEKEKAALKAKEHAAKGRQYAALMMERQYTALMMERQHAALRERERAALEERKHAALEERKHAALKEREHAALKETDHVVYHDTKGVMSGELSLSEPIAQPYDHPRPVVSTDVVHPPAELKPPVYEFAVDTSDSVYNPSGSDGKPNENQLLSESDHDSALLLSDAEDSKSIGPPPQTRPVMEEAQSQIRALFVSNQELQSVATDLLAGMGRDLLIENLKGLLLSYYKSQKQLARSDLEHAVVGLLGRTLREEKLAIYIADSLTPTSEHIRHGHEESMDHSRHARADMEIWISNNGAFSMRPKSTDSENADFDYHDPSGLEDEHMSDNTPVECAPITRAGQFLCTGNAFENLLLNMQMLLIPSEFHILAETLLTIPKDDVRIDRVCDPTFWNECKISIDEVTNVSWNWWPLSPIIPPLPEDRVRIWWKCHCGDELWEDIPDDQYHLFRRLLSPRKSKPRHTHLCQTAFRHTGRAQRTHSPVPNGSGPAPDTTAPAPAAYTGLVQSSLSVSSSPSGSAASSSLSRSASPTSSTDATSVVSASVSISSQQHMYVLLGIGGMRSTLDLEHMDVIKDTKTDAEFFKKLNDLYRSARGMLRILFSIWRLSHCDFVKFRRFRPKRVTDLCEDLPEDEVEYTYSPRPPEVTVSAPGITKHMWQHALHPCDGRLMGLTLGFCALGWFHDCVEYFNPDSSEYIVRIPKKHSEWLVETEGIDDAFGILTKEEPSILYVLVYHVLILAGPFAFWGWAMPRESRQDGSWDLQNPSVPVTIALSLLSLFWALAYPLKMFRDPKL
ncbi:hypothetical protein EDD37DRAFT_651800 [Exophiala viscosa]|uniref:uncharacterized protein n=1 Tax=Exophiala viscosa TaxID=2486360 RepID=UPI00219FF6E8|nr:hypothetical protein EDD37DRAFT_651800 [Exophiala viscosa]